MTTGYSHVVETMLRLVQWRIDYFPLSEDTPLLRSEPFTMGKFKWELVLSRVNQNLFHVLLEEIEKLDHPIASFNIRVISMSGSHEGYNHPEIRDVEANDGETHFMFKLNGAILPAGKLIIEIEFLDLKTASPNGGEPRSIWSVGFTQKDMNLTSSSSLPKMLSEAILTDITICASDGSTGAHRAVLAACSPVFRSMFSYDLKEKEMSTINISDMSFATCKVFLNYIYSDLQYQDFFNHRVDLVKAADKYDISDLKDECEKSLIEDIDTTNVLDRLQIASMYGLPNLKNFCMQYLVNFGKLLEIREEFDAFMTNGDDRELVGEVLARMLSVWKFY